MSNTRRVGKWNIRKYEYNNIPVSYCIHCMSLSIMRSADIDYCTECGGTEIESAQIEEWEKKYENKYKVKFLNQKKNGRRY